MASICMRMSLGIKINYLREEGEGVKSILTTIT